MTEGTLLRVGNPAMDAVGLKTASGAALIPPEDVACMSLVRLDLDVQVSILESSEKTLACNGFSGTIDTLGNEQVTRSCKVCKQDQASKVAVSLLELECITNFYIW